MEKFKPGESPQLPPEEPQPSQEESIISLTSKTTEELIKMGIGPKERDEIAEIKSGEIEMEEKKLFKPPQKLLRLIGNKGVEEEMILPTLSYDDEEYTYVMMRVSAEMEKFFGVRFSENHKKQQIINSALLDALKNAAEHGNKGDPKKKVRVGFWFGQNGALFGFRDEGDFYKQYSTKKLVESRTILPSTKKDPSGVGMATIYDVDKIYVSTKENVLYLVLTI